MNETTDQGDPLDKAGDAFTLQTLLWTAAVMIGLYFGDLLGVLLCGIGWVIAVIRLNRAGWGTSVGGEGIEGANNG